MHDMLYYIDDRNQFNLAYHLTPILICFIISIMRNNRKLHIKLRLEGLPDEMRQALKETREKRGWSQKELGSRIGLPQMHISGIESGKIVPRYDTLLEIVRMLDRDLIMVPRALVPVVQSLVRDHVKDLPGEGEERPLYAADRDEDNPQESRDEV
jgi:HTH-type transcriptional regulator / antitoxin HipB